MFPEYTGPGSRLVPVGAHQGARCHSAGRDIRAVAVPPDAAECTFSTAETSRVAMSDEQQCVSNLYGGHSIESSNDDMLWLLFGSFLIFYMQAGFAMLESGQVRRKNRKNMLLKARG